MPLKILVPYKIVSEAAGSTLVINHPARCSRCGKTAADYFETHRLRLRASRKRMGLYRQKYAVDKPYLLKIKVCETCYQADFLTDPDSFDRDPTHLGRLARYYSAGFMAGAIVAAAGLLLLTGILPDVGVTGEFQNYWRILAGAGLLIIAITWLLRRHQQNRLRADLLARGIDLKQTRRADVFVPVVDRTDDPNATALQVGVVDDNWAEECAKFYGWPIQSYQFGEERGHE